MAGNAGVEVARISVKVSPDTKRFRRDLKRDLEEVERSMKAEIEIEPDLDGFRSKVNAATSGLKAEVKLDVNRGSLNRIKDTLSGIKGPSFGGGINPALPAAILGGTLALAAPLAGLLTTALLTLPGLIAAAATPIAALALGLDGLKKAAETLKAPFDDLKATMSSAVKDQFSPVFESLKNVFPTLKASLPAVTQGLADVARSITDVVSSPAGLAKVQGTIDNIAAAISRSAPGIGKFTDGLLTMVQSFTGRPLAGFVDWLNNTGDAFLRWVEKMNTPSWFTGKTPFEDAFSGLGDTLKIVADALGGIAGKGLDFMSDPQKVADFNNGLKGIADSLVRITDLSNKTNNGNLFSSVMPEGFKLDGGFDFQSALKGLTDPFTSQDAPWRGMWEDIKAGAQEAYNNVTSTFSRMGSDISNVASQIGSSLSGAWDGIVGAAQGAWSSVVSTVQGAVSNVVGSVTGMVSSVVGALANLGAEGLAAGAALVQGLINGIGNLVGSAVAKARELASSVAGAVKGFLGINSPSKLFTEYGEYTGQGFGIGLENGFAPVLDQAKALAQKVADAFASGADPTGLLAGVPKQDIDRIEQALALESRRLESQAKALDYQAKTTGDKSLKGRADEIRMLKDQIGLQKEMLGLTQDYSDELGGGKSTDNPFAKAAGGLMAAPVNFAKQTGQQFLSDIGISGNGLISKAITEGINYVFNIGSVDEAMAIKQRQETISAMNIVAR